jgi:hypothetical protein
MIDTARALTMYRELKYDRLRDFPTDADLRTLATVWRHDEAVVHLIQGPGPEAARDMVYLAASLFRPELLVLVADAYALDLDDQDRGRSWEQGDLTEHWKRGRRKGLTEVLMVQAMNRAGEYRLTIQPYRITLTGITWKDPYDPDTLQVGGALTDAMREGWAEGELWRTTVAEAADVAGIDEAARDYHTDRAAARFVVQNGGHAVMLLGTGEFFVAGVADDD